MDETSKEIYAGFTFYSTHDWVLKTSIHLKFIKKFDAKLWHEDLQKKNSVILYREYKHVIHKEQDLYDNSAATTTLFKARTGTLKLERRHTDGYTSCETCKVNTTEDIEHFLQDCEALTSTRQYVVGLQRPYKENRETHRAEFLLFNNKVTQNISRNRDDPHASKAMATQELKNATITTNNFIEM